jgi:diaminopimelate decarboxylase
MLELFPETAEEAGGELAIGGLRAQELAAEHGTPLLVYCERTLRSQAGAYRAAAPDAIVCFGTKAFPNVALLRVFAEEGLGADVASLGELAFARRAGIPPEQTVLHGNNKSDKELAAAEGALVVLDSLDETERAAGAGVRRVLVRVTSGIEADTHEAIRTGWHGSKFGLPPAAAIECLRRALAAGLEVEGLHVHVGSQLLDATAAGMTVDWLAAFAASCREELGWTPRTVDLGGGLGVRHVLDEEAPSVEAFVGELLRRLERGFDLHGLDRPRVILEPGRSLVGRAGVTLYRVGTVKEASETIRYVAVDGGLSDNPRPMLYGARYSAVLANRLAEPHDHGYAVAGHHCEEEVLVRRALLPHPRRGDLLAVPATGGYTLALGSNYNATPRPAAVLVADGRARLIRRRESLDDLLALEVG